MRHTVSVVAAKGDKRLRGNCRFGVVTVTQVLPALHKRCQDLDEVNSNRLVCRVNVTFETSGNMQTATKQSLNLLL